MANKETDEQETEEVTKAAPFPVKLIIITALSTLLLGGGLVGGTWYLASNVNGQASAAVTKAADAKSDSEEEPAEDQGEDTTEVEPAAPPQYFSMDPKFVISFRNQKYARFMQFSIDVMTRDSDVIKMMEKHMPVIRSQLLMLFGNQEYEVMTTREGKEKLLHDTVTEINNVLKKVTGQDELESPVEEAYFTSFVIQ